jgi:hypothetical protein
MAAATAKVVKLKPKASFAAALKQTATVAPAKSKKTSVPTLANVPEEIKAAVDRYIEASDQVKIHTAEKDASGAQVIEFVREAQDADGYAGRYRNSYGVPGISGKVVKFVSSNRFSIDATDADRLQEILGDKFVEMIDQRASVVLKAEVMENEALQEELMALIGERFADFFETKLALAVREGFDQQVFAVVKQEDLPELRTLCRPYKPALR